MGGSSPGTGTVAAAFPDIAGQAAGGPFASSQNSLRQALLNSRGLSLGATPNMPTSFNLPGLQLAPVQTPQQMLASVGGGGGMSSLAQRAAAQMAAQGIDPNSPAGQRRLRGIMAFGQLGYYGAPGGSPGSPSGGGIGGGSSSSGPAPGSGGS